jgi:rhamnogalacturonyl hydrolase YesR
MQLNGKIGKAKFSYNAGQMLQAAALLYKLTKNKRYLADAQQLAEACFGYFFETKEKLDFPKLKNSNLWFHAVMMRGYIELAVVNGDQKYLTVFAKNLEFAWQHMRDKEGLFSADWTLKDQHKPKWLLDQCAFVEMYARLAKAGY